MEKMTSKEVCKLLKIVIGETEPIAEVYADEVREENLKTLIDVGNWVLDRLYFTADHRKDPYNSSSKVGERAYYALLEWKEQIEKIEEELA